MPFGHCGAQSLGRFTDGKWERRILLNPAKMLHRIPAPSGNRVPIEPPIGCQRHSTTRTDSGPSLVGILPRRFGDREFLFDESGSFQDQFPCRIYIRTEYLTAIHRREDPRIWLMAGFHGLDQAIGLVGRNLRHCFGSTERDS